jgi:hypothetical protein
MRRKPLLTYRGHREAHSLTDGPVTLERPPFRRLSFCVRPKFSQPASTSAEQQVNDHKRKNEAKAATAVITDTGPHIVAAAAE